MNLTCQVISTIDAFTALRDEWTALLDRSGIASPFLTWEWMEAWWESYGAGTPNRRLAIVTASRDGALVAVLPGYVRRTSSLGLGRWEFAFLGSEFESTDYLQVIEDPGAGTLLPDLLGALFGAEPDIDVLLFENVFDTHPLLPALQDMAGRAGYSFETEPYRTCPYLRVRGEWEDYLGSLSPKMRKNVRRATRQILESGGEFSLVTDRDAVEAAVRELFDLHARRFVAKDETTGFRADLRQPFHTRVSERFLERDILRLFRVRMEGRTIAALYCFEFANELFYFQSGIDPAWDKLSVGTALVGHAIKHAFDRRLSLFDFMRGGEEYKFRWTNTVREIVVARVGSSRKGRAVLAARRQALRAKRAVKRLLKPEAAAAAAPLPTATQ